MHRHVPAWQLHETTLLLWSFCSDRAGHESCNRCPENTVLSHALALRLSGTIPVLLFDSLQFPDRRKDNGQIDTVLPNFFALLLPGTTLLPPPDLSGVLCPVHNNTPFYTVQRRSPVLPLFDTTLLPLPDPPGSLCPVHNTVPDCIAPWHSRVLLLFGMPEHPGVPVPEVDGVSQKMSCCFPLLLYVNSWIVS